CDDAAGMDRPTLAACTGIRADKLPNAVVITEDPGEFHPERSMDSVLLAYDDESSNWYALLGLGPISPSAAALAGSSTEVHPLNNNLVYLPSDGIARGRVCPILAATATAPCGMLTTVFTVGAAWIFAGKSDWLEMSPGDLVLTILNAA